LKTVETHLNIKSVILLGFYYLKHDESTIYIIDLVNVWSSSGKKLSNYEFSLYAFSYVWCTFELFVQIIIGHMMAFSQF